jgi:hypothetical protein
MSQRRTEKSSSIKVSNFIASSILSTPVSENKQYKNVPKDKKQCFARFE